MKFEKNTELDQANLRIIIAAIALIAFGITVVAALAAWSARETYRVRMEDLGEAGAQPVDPAEYERLRTQALAQSGR